tara:strand:+ start:69 stop:443 length:375 start_codon:yes stop_codon:yes gene_type:complete
MRRKVLNVSYRRDSNTFEDWMKYEIEILNPDGSTEMIPAYGKDLQDALSRVNHDTRVEKLEKTTQRIPLVVWFVIWFTYLSGLWFYCTTLDGQMAGITFSIGMAAITFTTGYAATWFRRRNRDK